MRLHLSNVVGGTGLFRFRHDTARVRPIRFTLRVWR